MTPTTKKENIMRKVLDIAERVIVMYLTTLLGLLAASALSDGFSIDVAKAAAVAALPAAISLARNLVATLAADANGGTWWQDALKRTFFAFAQAFIGILALSSTLDVGTLKSAGIAGLVAALVVVKGVVAKFIGSPDTASLVPPPNETGEAD